MAKDEERSSRKSSKPFGGLLDSLTGFIEKLNELAEKGDQFARTATFDLGEIGKGKEARPLKGVYGLSVKLGLPGEAPKVEPFGNIRKNKDTGESVVEDVWEPIVDVFDEGDHVMVLAEMPGVEPEDIHIDITEQTLTLSAERGPRRYRKEIELPFPAEPDTMKVSSKNGIVEIVCPKRSNS